MSAVAHYLELWQLEPDGVPFETQTSTIQFVRRGGMSCVLKVGHAQGDEATAAVLSHYEGQGSVKVLASDGVASLLQRASPGTPLSQVVAAGRDDEATQIFCEVSNKLHTRPRPTSHFPDLERWGSAFEGTAAVALPAELVAEASATYIDLCASQTRRVLLHGDLHHDNILFDEVSGWLAIDPKGVIGEAEFESGAFLRNPTDDPRNFAVPEIIARRVGIMCNEQGWSRDRVLRWCFAQGVLSAIWSIEDGDDPTRGIATATAARTMI